ncbi:uncharacterized protein [Onthophagus taurus]|uniref:uncharacterized protein n=1 Tax=Onthophagus taurus TaxID=166361 RepID=UPI0039BE7935
MIPLTILGAVCLSWSFTTASSQQQPQQVLPPQQVNPPYPVPYGAYLQQIDAAGAQALPVQHSFTVNHSPYTYYPRPEIFHPPQSSPQAHNQSPLNHNPLLTTNNPSHQVNNNPPLVHNNPPPPPPPKYVAERRDNPNPNVHPYNNQRPIQFLSKTPQYAPQQIQPKQPNRQLNPSRAGIQVVPPPRLGKIQNNDLPIYGKISQGRPPVQPFLSQGEKFRQQAAGKNLPIKPTEEKYYNHHDARRIQVPIPPPTRNHPQRQQPRRKQEEEEEEEEEAREDSEEESEEEDESGEEDESEEEEEHDEKGEASDLPPEHNRSEYDFDNRNYRPTFDAAKYIFNRKQNQKKPGQKYYEDDVPKYHRERGYGYVYRKNTKSKPKSKSTEIEKSPTEVITTTERPQFAFYDSEPKFNPYEPYQFETPRFDEPPKFEMPKRIKAERVEITNGKPTYYYYSSPEPKPNDNKNKNTSTTKDNKPQATRKKMIREKWYVHTKET